MNNSNAFGVITPMKSLFKNLLKKLNPILLKMQLIRHKVYIGNSIG